MIVLRRGEFTVEVDRPDDARNVTLHHQGEEIGWIETIDARFVPGYREIANTFIKKPYRGNGWGLILYKFLRDMTASQGIVSYLPERKNKTEIPAIYEKLGGYQQGDYAYLPKPVDHVDGL